MDYKEDKSDDVQVDRSFGLTTDRIQSLNDNIFAFAMTILVLGFELPTNIVRNELTHVLYNLRPQIITYAVSFLALGSLWVTHHNQYHWIKRSNRMFLRINIFYLFFIVLIPFSTKLVANYYTKQLAVIIYGFNLIICLGILFFHWAYATRKQKLTDSDLNNRIVRLIKARIIAVIVVILIALGISYISIKASLIILIFAQFSSIMPTLSIDKFLMWGAKKLGIHVQK